MAWQLSGNYQQATHDNSQDSINQNDVLASHSPTPKNQKNLKRQPTSLGRIGKKPSISGIPVRFIGRFDWDNVGAQSPNENLSRRSLIICPHGLLMLWPGSCTSCGPLLLKGQERSDYNYLQTLLCPTMRRSMWKGVSMVKAVNYGGLHWSTCPPARWHGGTNNKIVGEIRLRYMVSYRESQSLLIIQAVILNFTIAFIQFLHGSFHRHHQDNMLDFIVTLFLQ